MTLGALLFCTAVLYMPHALLCTISLVWQPMLIILSLLSSFVVFLPVMLTGLLLRFLQLCQVSSDTTIAAWLLFAHFVFQNVARVCILHGCLQLQRLGWSRGWVLVRSHVPLVSLSIAVGAGFAGTSLLISGGALLAEAWAARLTIPLSFEQVSAAAVTLESLFGPSATCAQLPRLVQSVFQQTFFSFCQVAWTVMLGQAYAAACKQSVNASLLKQWGEGGRSVQQHDAGRTTQQNLREEDAPELGGHEEQEVNGKDAVERTLKRTQLRSAEAREGLARLVEEDVAYLPLVESPEMTAKRERKEKKQRAVNSQEPTNQPHEETELRDEASSPAASATKSVTSSTLHAPAGEKRRREEREADASNSVSSTATAGSQSQTNNTRGAPKTATPTESSEALASSSHSPLPPGLMVESVLAERQPIALLTGLVALGLHFLYVILPVAALSQTSSSSAPHRNGCAAYVPVQCAITIVSVVWALWIINCERHPSAYVRVG